MAFRIKTRFHLRDFMDRNQWQKIILPAERAMLMKFGAFVRRRAKDSIKPRSKAGGRYYDRPISAVGSTPTNRNATLRSNILFAVDNSTRSVVIGSRIVPGKFKMGQRDPAPGALEEGGKVSGRWLGRHSIRVRKRPYMMPAYRKVISSNLPRLLRNFIHNKRIKYPGGI